MPTGPGGTDAGGAANGPSGRGVPDVAGVADPQTGYRVRVDGKDLVIGGTSAVAPLWAALIARLVQSTGKPLGLAQPALYDSIAQGRSPPGSATSPRGDNGAYQAGPGWDACTGLGVPRRDGAAGRALTPGVQPARGGASRCGAALLQPRLDAPAAFARIGTMSSAAPAPPHPARPGCPGVLAAGAAALAAWGIHWLVPAVPLLTAAVVLGIVVGQLPVRAPGGHRRARARAVRLAPNA